MDFGETRRHQEDKTPHWCRREHATTGADQTSGPRPVTLSSEAARCWPSAGLRGGQLAVSSQVPRMVCGRLPLREHRGTGACSRLSRPVPGSRSEQGSHLPYTSEGPAPSATPRHHPQVPGWHISIVPGATGVAERAVLVCCGSLRAAVQRRPLKYSEVTGALVAGRVVT